MDQTKEQEYVLMASNPEQCPNCDNQGYTLHEICVDRGYGGECIVQELEQEQCEFCYENENSIFNYNKMISRLKGEHLK